MTIKAIQTRYKGYHFRSRLEARWAVFFDALGLEWEFEPEGYDLGVHGWYLPDFYFPQIDMFGEVKPIRSTQELDCAAMKCEELTKITGKGCLFLFGPPGEHNGMWGAHPEHGRMSYAWTPDMYWKNENRMYMAPGGEGRYPLPFPHFDEDEDFIYKAVIKARSARFEHGQSGATL